jgi:hypothetical protein
MEAYVWLGTPTPVRDHLGTETARQLEPFSSVVAHTHFGDLYLRDPESLEFAVLLQGTGTLFNTGFFDESEFRNEYLAHAEIVQAVLRPADVAALENRLGRLASGEAYFPVPIPALGGTDDLTTYERGGLWEYVSFVVQTLGVTIDRA